jgi:hypothetical protein
MEVDFGGNCAGLGEICFICAFDGGDRGKSDIERRFDVKQGGWLEAMGGIGATGRAEIVFLGALPLF